MGDDMDVLLDLRQQAERLHFADDAIAHLEPVRAQELLRRVLVQPAAGIEDVDHLEPMAAADLEVVEVMRRRDLDGARTLLGIGVLIGDDRDAPADDGEDGALADQIPVAAVVGMDRDRGIAEHRFGPGGGDGYVFVFSAFDRVLKVP